MNRPIVMAQLGGASAIQSGQPPRIIKLAKPSDGQAQTVFLGYQQQFKIDLSGIANEKLTFVQVGERLVILFDNKSTLTLDPFFDSAGTTPRNNIAFDVNGREIDGSQFASAFPITTDQSVLPAAGDGAGAPASGANFSDASVDPFGQSSRLDLLGQEELGTFVINQQIRELLQNFLPSVSANDALNIDEDGLSGGNLGGVGDFDLASNGPVILTGTLAFSFGNDGAGSVVLLGSGAPAGFAYVLSDDGLVLTVTQSQNGVDVEVLRITLADDTSGNYTIEQLNAIRHEAGGDENDQDFVFTYRVTDSNGDTIDGSLSLSVDDDTPAVAENASVQLDDEAASTTHDLPNAGGTGDVDPDTANLTGTLGLSFGADGGTVEWLPSLVTSGGATGLSVIVDEEGTLLIQQDQNGTIVTVMTVTLDPANGAYTVTQNAPLFHAPGDDDNDQTFTLTYRVTDNDGDTVDGTLLLNVDDDAPTVAENAAVQLDDESASPPYDLPNAGGTGDVDPDTANLTGTLGLSFGADGGSVAWLPTLITSGGATGLSAIVDDSGALLVQQDQNGTLVTVMTVTLDPANGAYTVTHNAPLFHAEGNDENDESFTLTYRVTDNDGDTVDGTLTVNVDDDTPTIEVSVSEGDGSEGSEGEGNEQGPGGLKVFLPTLDESIGMDFPNDTNADFDDVPPNEIPDPSGTNPIGRVTSYLPPQGEGEGQGQLATLFDVTASPGADGADSLTQQFSLTLTGGVGGPGVETTLTNTALEGVPSGTIYLFQISETEIVGRIGNDPNGDIALRITVLNPDNPAVAQLVIEQYLPIDHGQDGNAFDSTLPLTFAGESNSLGLTFTATIIDQDGDAATSSATIVLADNRMSSINIEDDGPKLLPGQAEEQPPFSSLELDETIGEDRYNLNPAETPDGSNGDDTAATGVAAPSTNPASTDAIGARTTIGGAISGLFPVYEPDFGTDGPGTFSQTLSFALSSAQVATNLSVTALDNTPLENLSAAQRAIVLVDNNGVIEGRIVGDGIDGNGDEFVAFRITINNANDPANATITVEQFLPIDHGADGTSVYDEVATLLLSGEGALDLHLVTTITDGDSDQIVQDDEVNLLANENSFISFDDDGPIVSVEANASFSINHDETLLLQAPDDIAFTSVFNNVNNPGDDQDVLLSLPLGYARSDNAALTITNVDFGSDGAASAASQVFSLTLTDAQGNPTNGPVDSGLTTTEGRPIYLFIENGLVVGRFDTAGNVPDGNDRAAFAIAINSSTGIVSLVQYVSLFHDNSPLDHDEPAFLDGIAGSLNATLTVADADGDTASASASIGASISFDDDGPSFLLGGVKANPGFTLTTDESPNNQADDVTGPIAVFANVQNVGVDPDSVGGQPLAYANENSNPLIYVPLFGVDGPAQSPAQAIAYALTLSDEGVDSGLTVTDGSPVSLFTETDGVNTWIVGRVEGGDFDGDAAFAIYINPVTGAVSVVQYLSLEHFNTANHNEPIALASGVLAAQVTITDGDFDTATAQADISGRIVFRDDGPTIIAEQTETATVDEDGLASAQSDGNEDGNPLRSGEVTGTGSNAFVGGPGALNNIVNFGADGFGSFALKQITTPWNSTFDSQGKDVWVVSDGTTVRGYADNGGSGYQEGVDRLVFTLTVNPDGSYVFTLLDQIDHPTLNGENGDNGENLLTGGIDLSRFVVATDGDGDSVTLPTGSFKVQVLDDIPVVVVGQTRSVDEDDLSGEGHPGNSDVVNLSDDLADPSPVTVSGSFGVSFGADGPAATGAISAVTLTNAVTSDGAAVTVVADGANWVGRAGGRDVFALSFDTTTGQYTFTLLDNLDHPVNSTEDNLQLNFSFVAQDYDRDAVNGSFSIIVDDDMPVVAPPPQNLLVNGDFVGGTFNGQADFPNSYPWGDNGHGGIDTNGIEGWTVTGGQIERVGNNYLGMVTSNGNPMIDMAASPGNIQIAQTLNGLSTGQTYVLQFEAGAPVPSSALLEVYWNNVLIATIDATGPMTTYDLLVTAAGPSGTISFREIGLDNGTSVSPTPGTHGHHGTYLANISFSTAPSVDEDGLTFVNSDGNAVGVGDSNQIGDAPGNSNTVTAALGINWGADDNDTGADVGGIQDTQNGLGDRSLTFTNANVTVGGAAALTSNGAPVSFQLVDNNTRLIGYVNSGDPGYSDGERIVFEVLLSDDDTGAFTFILRDNLDHAPGANENDIALSFNYTARDSDGDVAKGSFVVTVDDDVPVPSGTSMFITLDEDGIVEGSADAGQGDGIAGGPAADVAGEGVTASGGVALLFKTGADAPLTFAIGDVSALIAQNLTSNNVALQYGVTLNGNVYTITGSVPAGDVFTFTLNATSGTWTFTLLDQLDHPTGDGENNLHINFGALIIATDSDGDSTSPAAGAFQIIVNDDTPIQTKATVSTSVDEDNLTGQSIGNVDPDLVTTVATGTLAPLAQSGADEPVTFSLIASPTGLPVITSQGAAVVYNVSGSVLTAFVDTGAPGFDSGDRKVFTLDLQPNGSFTFTLLDQIDHLPNSPANDDEQSLVLDFTSAVQFRDADGDYVQLTGMPQTTNVGIGLHPGHYNTLTVAGVTFDGLTFTGSGAQNFQNPGNNTDSFNVSGQGVGIGNNLTQNGEGFMISRAGTDSVSFEINGTATGTISWQAYSGGVPVSGASGFASGSMAIPADGQIVAIDPAGTFDHIVIRFDITSGSLRADNFFYSTTTTGGVFTVAVEDDIAVANAGGVVSVGTVHEDALPTGHGEGPGQVVSRTFTAASLASLISVGADEQGEFVINSAVDGQASGVNSHGLAVTWDVVDIDTVRGVTSDNRVIFTLVNNNDGTFTFALLDQVDHGPLNSGQGDAETLDLNIGSAFAFTDFDGDTVAVTGTVNLTIENDIGGNTNASITIGVAEDHLNTGAGDGVSGIPAGAGYAGDEIQITTAALQTLVQTGADEEATFSLNQAITGVVYTLDGEPVTSHASLVRLDYFNGQIVGFVNVGASNTTYEVGDRIVFTLTPNLNGFEFDLRDQLDHDPPASTGSGESEILTLDLSRAILATDFDGDSINLGVGSVRVVVENDIPALVINPSAVALVVDDSSFASDDTENFANFLQANYGADGPGGVTNFALQTSGGPSGLIDTLTNSQVVLVQQGAMILGVTSEGGFEVFRLTVDGSGNVTLNQSRAVVHNDPLDPLETGNSAAILSGANLITLSATITDSDGDSVGGSRDITALLRFEDDGPSIDRSAMLAPTLTTDDTATPGSSNGTSFAGLFTSNFGNDGFRDQNDDDVEDLNAIRYALSLPGSNVPSGVFDTITGEQVVLNVVGNSIVGSISGNTTVFTISVDLDTGFVSLNQARAVRHDNASDPDEAAEPTMLAAGAQITLTATIEDGDGDTDMAVADITGSFAFRDDGPSVQSVVPDSSINLIVNGSFENPASVPNGWLITNSINGWLSGADGIPFEIQQGGAGGLSAQHGANLVELDSDTTGNTPNVDQNPVNGTNATILQSVATVPGEAYTLSFWYAPRPGSEASSGLEVRFGGNLVFTLLPNANNPAVWQQFTVTVTASSASSVLAFTGTGTPDELGVFLDNVSLTASPVLDDEDTTRTPAVEVQGGPGDDGAGVVSTGTINFNAGKDTFDRFEVTGVSATGQNGPLSLQAIYVDGNGVGAPQNLTIQSWLADGAGGGTMTWGTASIPVALTLRIEADGSYTFTQYAPLAHPATNNLATPQTETAFEDNLQLSFGFRVYDKDGDSAPGTITVNVDDDTPLLANDTDSVAEGAVATGNVITDASAGDNGDGDNGADARGADGGSITGVTGAGPTTVVAGVLHVIGQYGTLMLQPDGGYSYAAYGNISNASPVTDTFTYTLTDGDGDQVTATLVIQVADGTNPSVVTNAVISVDEEGLGNANATGSAAATAAELGSGTVTFQAGSDNITNIAFGPTAGITLEVNGLPGNDISWSGNATQLIGTINGIAAIRIDLVAPVLPIAAGATGSATVNVTLLDNFPHPNANGQNVINLTGITVVATDLDGDPIPATVQVNVIDDVPTVIAPAQTGNVQESDLPLVDSTFGNLNIAWNADSNSALVRLTITRDGNGDPVVPTGLASGGVPLNYIVRLSANGVDEELVAFKTGETANEPVFIAALNAPVNPAFALTLFQPLDHPAQGTDTLPIQISVTGYDSDGDPVTQTFTVNVLDEIPSVEVAAAVLDGTPDTDTVAEDGGNLSGAITLVEGADQDATFTVTVPGPATLSQPLSFTLDGTAQSAFATVSIGANVLGVLTIAIEADGTASWTFDPALDVNNTQGNPSFTFVATVTDKDNDVDTDQHTITITDGQTATATTLSLTVQESDLDVIGTTAADSDETDAGSVTFTAHSDDITGVAFGSTAGISIAGLDNLGSVTWTGQNTDTLTGSINGTPVIQLTITGTQTAAAGGNTVTPTITATLLAAFPHENNLNVNSLTITGVQAVATESDGETATATVDVTVTDDLPEAEADANSVNEGTLLEVDAANGVLANDSAGADGYDGGSSVTTPVPVGGEFRVSGNNPHLQYTPAVAALDGGGFVVTWMSQNQDGSGYGVYGQRYDVSGAAVGGEFRVNTVFANDQSHPSVAALADGAFIVTWNSNAGGNYDIYGQLYDSLGAQVGTEFRISPAGANEQIYSSVTGLDEGGFVVTWLGHGQDGSGYGVYAQRFSDAGAPLGGEFRVNTYTSSDQFYPSVADIEGGGFVVTWSSAGQDGSAYGIYGQRYNASGIPLGGEFHASSQVSLDQWLPSVAGLKDGGFVITWSSSEGATSSGIYGQRYDANGIAVGPELHINSTVTGEQYQSSITALDDGGFIVSWNSYAQDGDEWGIFAQRFDSLGNPVGTEFRLNQSVAGRQFADQYHGNTTIDQLDNGDLIAVWYGQPSSSGYDIYARQFDVGESQAVMGVRAAGLDTTTPVFGGVDASITGLYGTLILHGDGSYSYQSNPNAVTASGAQDVFVYTIRDGDGDLSTTTLTINVNDVSPPTVVSNAVISVDEEGIETANARGSAENPTFGEDSTAERDSDVVTFQAGSDDIVSMAFGATAGVTVDVNGDAVADITWSGAGTNQLIGKINGITAITIDLTPTLPITAGNTGSATVSVTLSDNFPHLFGDNAQTQVDLTGITVVALDTDNTAASATVTVTVVDDVPTVTGPAQSGSVQESDLASVVDSTNGGLGFNWGADGAGARLAIARDGNGDPVVTAGLKSSGMLLDYAIRLTSNGVDEELVAFKTGDTVANPVFIMALNAPLNPSFAFSLFQPLDHASAGADTLPIQFSVIGYDSDGDAIPRTFTVNVLDAVPSINVAAHADDLTVDETTLTTDASANFADNFTSAFGEDGGGAITYALGVNAGASGLVDTATGLAVVLSVTVGGVVEGRAGAAGPVVFTVSVNAVGTVTLDQLRAVVHADGGDPNDSRTLSAANLVTLTGTITDGDGDSASAVINIGQKLTFLDDGPDVDFAGEATVNENGVPDSAANGTYRFFVGADGLLSGSLTIDVNGSGAQTIQANQILDNVHTVVTSAGTLVLSTPNASGNGTWTFTPSAVTATATVNISITTTDRDNDSDSDTHSFQVVNVNSPLAFNAVTGVVEEEHALANGIDDATSNTAPTDLDGDTAGDLGILTNAVGGNFASAVASGQDGALTFSFVPPAAGTAVQTVANGPLKSGGDPVLFHQVDATTLIGYTNSDGGTGAFGDAGDTTVFTLTLASGGAYTFTLNAPIDHPLNSVEDAIAIDLGGRVRVTDAGGPAGDTNLALTNVSITVIDDVPVAQSDAVEVFEPASNRTNVLLILDTSGSMAFDGDLNTDGTQSRISLMQQALQNLFNTGNVNAVNIVWFESDGHHIAGPVNGWFTDLSSAMAAINGLSADGGTDYDSALAAAIGNYTAPPAGASRTIAVFMSDGQPTEHNGTDSVGIDDDDGSNGGEETTWINFLDNNNFAASYAVGFGGLADGDVGYLEPIAWSDGETHSTYHQDDTSPSAGDANDAADDPNVQIVTPTSLTQVLQAAVGGLANGNVITDGTIDDGFGADGGRVLSIVINNVTYVWDGATTIDPSSGANIAGTQLNNIVTGNGGSLSFNFANGAWSYSAPSNLGTDLPESFQYVIRDGDGDTSTASLSILVRDINDAPAGTNNTVSVQEDSSYTFAAADFGFSDPDETPPDAFLAVRISTPPAAGTLFFDADGAGGGAATAVTAGQSISVADIALGRLYFTPAANGSGTGYASFSFQVQDNGGTANGGVDLDQTPNMMTINVAALNDAPVLNNAATPVLNGVGEDAAAPSGVVGTLVSALVNLNPPAGGGLDNVTDADGSLTGIALTGTAGNGTWYYSINNGSSWTAVGAVSDTSARLLAADAGTRLYFRPNADFNGTVTDAITFRAWDQSSGTNGQSGVNVSVNGASTAFSAATDTANVTVSAVADIVADTVTTAEDTAISFNPVAGTNGAEADNFEATPQITHINGTAITAGGSAVAVTGGSVTLAAGNILTFAPAADFSGAVPPFSYTVLSGGVSETANITVTVSAAADIVADTVTTNEDTAISFNPIAGTNGAEADNFEGPTQITHINGTAITAGGAAVAVTNGSVTLSAGNVLTFTPAADFNGTVPTFSYTVLSGGVSETANITVTVNAAADIVADTVTTAEDTAISFNPITGTNGAEADNFEGTPQITHINGTAITAGGAAVAVTNGSVTLAAGNVLTFTPAANFYGVVPPFSYTVTSGGVTETASVSVTVTPVADAPVAGDDNIVVNSAAGDGTSFLLPEWALLVNDRDADGDSLDVTATSVVSSLQSVSLATNPGFVTVVNTTVAGSGSDNTWGQFSYTLTAGGQTDTANAQISQDTNGNLSGTEGNDILLDLTTSSSTLNGGEGNDVLIGNTGGDTLNGGDDDDYLVGGVGSDDLNGGSGNDTASYLTSTAAVSVNLDDDGDATDNMSGATPSSGEVGGDANGDDLTSIENLVGGSGGDYLAGNSSDNILVGNGGNDTLLGEGGNDTLVGGAGVDTITGGTGLDVIRFDQTTLAGNHDVVSSYNGTVGDANRDILDVSALLDSAFNPATHNVNDFVRVIQNNGGAGDDIAGNDADDFLVQVDLDGAGAGSSFGTVAVLNNYNNGAAGTQNVAIYLEGQEYQFATPV